MDTRGYVTWLKRLWEDDWLYVLAMALLLASFVVWAGTHLGGFLQDVDEGANLVKARMLYGGYRLYRDVWSDQPPLFTVCLAGAFSMFGGSVHMARIIVLASAALCLATTAWIARLLGGRMSSLAAVLFLVFSPHFLRLARSVTIGLPAMSLSVLALALGMMAVQKHRRDCLLAGGFLFAISLLADPTMVILMPSLGMILWLRTQEYDVGRWRTFSADLLFLVLAVGAPLLVAYCLFDGPLSVEQVIGTWRLSQVSHSLRPGTVAAASLKYVAREGNAVYWIGVPLALHGVIVSWREGIRKRGLIVSVWLLATCVALVVLTPFRPQNLFLVSYPLAGLLAIGLEDLVVELRAGWIMPQEQWYSLGVALVILIAFVVSIGDQMVSTLTDEYERADSVEEEAMSLLRSYSEPGDYIISDQGMFAFRGGYLVPPHLGDISEQRVATGGLTSSELIQTTQEHKPRAIVFWEDRLLALQEYVEWVDRNYCLVKGWDPGHRIYVEALKRAEGLNARLGDHFLLSGWTLAVPSADSRAVSPGSTIVLSLRWRTLRATNADYALFAHTGEPVVVAQHDSRPYHWGVEHPTYNWEQEEEVVDTQELVIPSDTPPGYYPLRVGMYDMGNEERLPIVDTENHPLGTSLLLTRVRIGRPRMEMPDIPFPREATLGEVIHLLGYDLSSAEIRPGESLSFVLYWQCLEEMSTSYTVFVHLLDHERELVGQGDAVPHGGDLPTSEWVAGEVIADGHRVPVSEIPPGVYGVEVGMYDTRTGERLSAMGPNGERLPEDRIPLVEIIVNE